MVVWKFGTFAVATHILPFSAMLEVTDALLYFDTKAHSRWIVGLYMYVSISPYVIGTVLNVDIQLERVYS